MHRFLPLLLVVAACAVEPPEDVAIEEHELAAAHGVDVLVPLAGAPIAIVQDGGTLFWIDRNDATVVKMPAAGGVTTVLATGAQALAPWTLAADATHVYWQCRSLSAFPQRGRLPRVVAHLDLHCARIGAFGPPRWE
jgi:hypothetical protein